ncbi:keratin, type I cytoskeletal 9-like [Aphidius gifuensis]|uniref:keratin, type I cytoskeletal 9-like n=1 Tax=Aphidius gifuensis TaxID=684658 RepID=UPI001CDC66AA|nr:keratin, type I cytoskeletal 9-like [Aphidius gifuensis]
MKNLGEVKRSKRVLRYLKGSIDTKLVYKRTGKQLYGVADADWAGDRNDRKSYTGYAFILAGASISWESRKQRTIALSSTEAEYMKHQSQPEKRYTCKSYFVRLHNMMNDNQRNLVERKRAEEHKARRLQRLAARREAVELEQQLLIEEEIAEGIIRDPEPVFSQNDNSAGGRGGNTAGGRSGNSGGGGGDNSDGSNNSAGGGDNNTAGGRSGTSGGGGADNTSSGRGGNSGGGSNSASQRGGNFGGGSAGRSGTDHNDETNVSDIYKQEAKKWRQKFFTLLRGENDQNISNDQRVGNLDRGNPYGGRRDGRGGRGRRGGRRGRRGNNGGVNYIFYSR